MLRSKLRIILTIVTVAVGAIAASGASAQPLVSSGPAVTSTGAPIVHVVALVKGYSTGEPGSASDETCAGLAKDVNDAFDHAGSELQMGDEAAGVKVARDCHGHPGLWAGPGLLLHRSDRLENEAGRPGRPPGLVRGRSPAAQERELDSVRSVLPQGAAEDRFPTLSSGSGRRSLRLGI